MLRKTSALLMIFLILFSFASCGKAEYKPRKDNDSVSASAAFNEKRIETGCTADSYTMDIALDAENNTVSGNVIISLTNQSGGKLDEICIRFFAPAVTEASQINSIKNATNAAEYNFTEEIDNTFIRVPLENDPFENGESLSFDISFVSYIPQIDDRFGFYEFDSGRIYNMCFCFPQLAFLDEDGWSDSSYISVGESTYNEVSDYYVTFRAPEDYIVVSSGKSSTEGGITTIEAPGVREMAISACNSAELESREVNGITFNVLRPDYNLGSAEYTDDVYDIIFEAAIESVRMFTQKVGSYIYDEIDIVPVPLSESGGMEMPGLIYIASPPDYLEGYGNESEMDFLIHIVSHEVAHEWFCYAVGNDQYNEPWLDEAFASYLEYYFCRNTRETNKLWKEYMQKYSSYSDYVPEISTENYFPNEKNYYINLPYDKYDKKKDDYFYIYSYGEQFLTKLEEVMGEEKFFEMLSDWYNKNTDRTVKGYLFVQHLLEYDSSEEVRTIINSYISDQYLG